ncbi:ABC transporter permease [Clostridium sp. Marseille-P299]|uniref:ABC transporter permease n=1 Tax=Clostridium sp. Marseille-P299 TaxID=1805477 RepID=UPI00082C1C19|nr:ABC transporter permease subunit [Clostridium sp. Marseille-P299]
MLAIYKKEIKAYFTSIVGYLFIAFFLAIIGLYHYLQNMYGESANFSYALYSISIFFVLLVPMITMRIMAEENKQKTDQLLLTSPISITKIIVGKYLAVISVFTVVMGITCIYPLVMANYGTVNFKMNYAAIFAFFLLGASYMAIGLFISAMTESQAFAAVVTFIVILLTYLATGIGSIMPTDNKTAWITFSVLYLIVTIITYVMMHNLTLSFFIGCIGEIAIAALYLLNPTLFDGSVVKVLGWFSMITRFDTFIYGNFDVAAVVYYISLIVLFIFLTIQTIKKRRWS